MSKHVAGDDPLLLDNQVCFQLYALQRAVTALYRPLLAELELTYPQYLVMLVLWESEHAGSLSSVSVIGQRLQLDSGTLTPLLKRLEEQGRILRTRSEKDERVVVITLTESGRSLREKALAVPGQVLCATGLTIEDVSAVHSTLGRFKQRLMTR